MFLRRLFAPRSPSAQAPRALYDAAVEQARRPAFYSELGVPDTLDGRFELICLHVYLILRRLRADHAGTGRLAQDLFDTMFADMDGSLRELGAGDLGVGPRVKKMARNFYGRVAAYDAGIDGSDAELEDALRRNLYGTVAAPEPASVTAMAGYTRREAAALADASLQSIAAGEVHFGAPPPAEASQPAADSGARAKVQD